MSKRPTRGAFVQGLSIEKRHEILAKNGGGDDLAQSLGIMPVPKKEEPNPKAKPRSRKASFAGILFDSEGEMNAYMKLRDCFHAVFCHPKIELSAGNEHEKGRHMCPDFIVVHEVLPDGRFIAEALDYKGEWKQESGKKKAHAEPVWRLRRSWLIDKTRIVVRIITNTTLRTLQRGGPVTACQNGSASSCEHQQDLSHHDTPATNQPHDHRSPIGTAARKGSQS